MRNFISVTAFKHQLPAIMSLLKARFQSDFTCLPIWIDCIENISDHFWCGHRRTGRGGRGGTVPPHFSGSLRFHSGSLPESTQICPNSMIIFKFFSNSGGRAPQTPHFLPFLRIFDEWSTSLAACEILRAPEISRFGHFEVRFGQFGWCAPPLKISPYAYGYHHVTPLIHSSNTVIHSFIYSLFFHAFIRLFIRSFSENLSDIHWLIID